MTSRRWRPGVMAMSPSPSSPGPCWRRSAPICRRVTRGLDRRYPMHTPPRLLVVDDQPMNIDILCSRLAVYGYEILTAHSGDEAVTLATTQQPDLLLLDVLLPMQDGLAVCRQLKAAPSLPFLPIIMVSAKTAVPDILAGLEAGADDYLTKPVDQAVLMARVQAMLRLKARHDRLQGQADQWAAWSQTLEHRVQAQVTELER